MTRIDWDSDLAVCYGQLEEELEGGPTIDRYGITMDEELAGEPLRVALAQEEPDAAAMINEDPWAHVDDQWEAEDEWRAPLGAQSPEESAMHLERP